MSRYDWFPPLRWLASYRAAYLRSDLVAGLTTSAVVIPQAMAYATIAGLPLQAGLYCALLPMAVYALLGSSRPLSVSTTSTISLLTAHAIASSGGDPSAIAVGLAALVGAILLFAGILRLGFLADFMSPHTLLGFKIGTGLLIVADQVGKILGVEESGSNFFDKMGSVISNLGETSFVTLALGGTSVVVLVLLHRYSPRLPGPLIVLILGIVAVGVFSLDSAGVALSDGVPTGLPAFSLPDLGMAGTLIAPASGIALVAFVESIGAARTFRRIEDPPLGTNQELVALGTAGLAGSISQAYPVGGGLSQTSINDSSGSASQASGLFTSLVVLMTLLFLAPLFNDLAEATLGALVLVAAAGLVDVNALNGLRRLGLIHWFGAVVPLLVVLTFGTLEGVLVGVVLSLFITLRALNQPHLESWESDTDSSHLHLSEGPRSETVGQAVAVVRMVTPIYYANQQRTLAALEAWAWSFEPAPRAVVVEFPAQGEVGPVFPELILELERVLQANGTKLAVAGLPERAETELRRSPRWSEIEGTVSIASTVEEALRAGED